MTACGRHDGIQTEITTYSQQVTCAACLDDSPHTRGEFVLGLGWSCVECDTFYCPVANTEPTP